MPSLRACAALAALISALHVHAETRTYAGSVQTNWKTVGKHGHDQPMCADMRTTSFMNSLLTESPNCNPIDFANGNLDNSIGFRGGVERDFLSLGRLSLVGGFEGAVSYTEYNLTQVDFVFGSATATAGADLRLGTLRLGGRMGAGPFATSDGAEHGFLHVQGVHLTVPLRSGAAIRIARQQIQVFGRDPVRIDLYGGGSPVPAEVELRREPRAVETSLLLVTSPEYVGSTRWDFSAATGTTSPGGPLGSSRMLRSSNYSQVAAFRELPWRRVMARVTWTSSAHESTLPTRFRGYDGNYRSKTINGLGLGLARTTGRLFDHFSLRYGGGVEVADWRDEHQLLTRNGQPLVAGVEVGLAVDAALRWHIAPHLALETSFEKVHWRNIDLGESRAGFGIVITR
jgi:hypothetical protein